MANILERINKKGEKTYQVRIRIKGRPTVVKTFNRKTDAKEWAKNTETDIKRGLYFKMQESSKHTLAELIDRYIEFELPQRKSDKSKFEMQLNWWKDKIGAYLLSDITPPLISKYKDILGKEESPKPKNGKKTRSNATVNRYMACLSIVLSKATKEWGWMDENPMFKVSKKKEPKGRIRFLSDDERKRLLEECKKSSYELYLLVLIALSTGARYSEIANLKWQHVDLKNRMFHFMDTKNGEDRGVPITGIIYGELDKFSKIRNIKSDFVFISSDGIKLIYFRDKFTDTVEAAGINDFRFHDLRHTAASYLAMNGASLLEIAEILGHKTLAMVKRYSHLTKKHTATVLERMNEAQFQNIGGA
jgi:integrase